MIVYIIKRILLIIPTLLGIMIINFLIIQSAPGGPVEKFIAQMKGINTDVVSQKITHSDNNEVSQSDTTKSVSSKYRGSQVNCRT